MRWLFLPLLLAARTASAAPIHELATTEFTYELKPHNLDVDAFRVIAATPVLTADINTSIAADAGILGGAENDDSRDVGCKPGILTDAFVSWQCEGILYAGEGGTAKYNEVSAYFIVDGKLNHATLPQLFTDPKKLAALKGDGCTPDLKYRFVVTAEGITFTQAEESCALAWDVLSPLLRKDSVLRRIVVDEAVEGPEDNLKARWAKAAQRFVRTGDVVTDAVSGLQWAAKDNGVDVNHAGAVAFAKTFTAGGFTDWRLPTEAELEMISDPALARRSKTDCTKGKNALLITPLIELSCGLAWSSSTFQRNGRPIAFGFISGTPRAAKATDKKNFRALLVRTPPKKPK